MRQLADVSHMDLTHEVLEVLHAAGGATVERIVSNGHSTGWLVQDHAEWVLVFSGSAQLEYATGDTVELSAGEALVIPAGVEHRVARTAQPTIWVAVHFPPAA